MLTQARLKELLSYDPLTGEFTNIKSGKGRKPVGSVVGSTSNTGYVTSMIDGKNYQHHRLAWLYVHGYLPPEDIDHIDGIRANNRFANLRLASRWQNCQNTAIRSDNTSGTPGLNRVGTRWRVRTAVLGVYHHIGYFDTIEEAREAYLEAKARLHKFQPVPRYAQASCI